MLCPRLVRFGLCLALAGPAWPQEAHVGLGIGLAIPTGAFNNSNFPPAAGATSYTSQGYDNAVGGQFTVSWPLDQDLAVRLDLYGQATTGEDVSPGNASYDLRHFLVSIGGEVQWFVLDGDAILHRGTYLLAGPSLDLERFSSSPGDPAWPGYAVNKARPGGLVACGYSFPPFGRWRTNAEVAYHRTLHPYGTTPQTDPAAPATPPADFLRITYGLVF